MKTEPIDFVVCDSNFVWFAATFTPKANFPTYWERSTDGGGTWSRITANDVFSYRGDSLVIKPVSIAAGMQGNKFRRVLDMPGNVTDVYSYVFTMTIDSRPEKSPFSLTIRDGSDNDMQDGDVREAHQIVFHIYDTVNGGGGSEGYEKLCVMRRVDKDSVQEVACQTAPFSFPLEIAWEQAKVE